LGAPVDVEPATEAMRDEDARADLKRFFGANPIAWQDLSAGRITAAVLADLEQLFDGLSSAGHRDLELLLRGARDDVDGWFLRQRLTA
jgi:hypothetical protein